MAGHKGSISQEEREARSERMKKLNAKKAAEKKAAEIGKAPETVTNNKTKPEAQVGINKKPSNGKDMSWIDDKVTITLHEMEGMPSHQYVGLNGRGYIIKVGEEVTVPRAVLNVLNDAVIETKEYIPVAGMPGAFNVRNKVIRRFAISSKV